MSLSLDLSEPVDVYSDWIDACEAVNTWTRERGPQINSLIIITTYHYSYTCFSCFQFSSVHLFACVTLATVNFTVT